jgi:predicted transcriptional regulator
VNTEQVFEDRPLERVFQNAYARVLDFLLLNQRFDYSYSDISRLAGVPPRTLQRVLPVLLRENLVAPTRKSGKAQMYEFNRSSSRAKALESYFNETMREDFTRLKKDTIRQQKENSLAETD